MDLTCGEHEPQAFSKCPKNGTFFRHFQTAKVIKTHLSYDNLMHFTIRKQAKVAKIKSKSLP